MVAEPNLGAVSSFPLGDSQTPPGQWETRGKSRLRDTTKGRKQSKEREEAPASNPKFLLLLLLGFSIPAEEFLLMLHALPSQGKQTSMSHWLLHEKHKQGKLLMSAKSGAQQPRLHSFEGEDLLRWVGRGCPW